MKYAVLIVVAVIFGFVAGWSIRGLRVAQEAANTKELARLLPTQHAHSALKDMRVITLLNSNDVVMARRLLIQDLQSHASLLEGLGREIELRELDKQALKDSEAFLLEAKR